MTTPKDLSHLKHSLVNTPMHFYSEVKEDGTEVLRHIRVQQKNYEVPTDGSGITIDSLPIDSVGSEQIKDGSVQREDLSEAVRSGLTGSYDADSEQLEIG